MSEGSDDKDFSSVQLVLGIFNKLLLLSMQNNQRSILVERYAPPTTTHFVVFLGQISLCNLSYTLNLHLPLMTQVDLTEEIKV